MWLINTQRTSLLMSQPTTYLFIIKKMGTSPLTGRWADKGQPGLPRGPPLSVGCARTFSGLHFRSPASLGVSRGANST